MNPEQIQSQLTERARKIRLIMCFFNCSYATAAQFYSALRNYSTRIAK